MIKINATLHTKGGLTISTGSVINVTPHFITPIKTYDENDVFNGIKYPVSFDVEIYKNIEDYKIKGNIPATKESIKEFNKAYHDPEVDLISLTSVDGLLSVLIAHIENGDDEYPGIGVGNCEIVYPTV